MHISRPFDYFKPTIQDCIQFLSNQVDTDGNQLFPLYQDEKNRVWRLVHILPKTKKIKETSTVDGGKGKGGLQTVVTEKIINVSNHFNRHKPHFNQNTYKERNKEASRLPCTQKGIVLI